MSEENASSDLKFAAGCSPVCDVVRKPKRRKRKSRPLHRWLGMLATLPLVWVLVTGFFLNHADDFKLDEKFTNAPWIMRAYGMMPKGEPLKAPLECVSVAEWDGVVFVNDQVVEQTGTFLGAAKDGEMIALVYEDAALRYNAEGELIESLDELSLPTLPLTGIGQYEGQAFIKNADGWHRPDVDWIEWQKAESTSITTLELEVVDDESLRAELAGLWNGGGLSYYRVMLDLHAGNFLGSFAKYFYDLVIVCTLWLISTGLVLQYRATRRQKVSKS